MQFSNFHFVRNESNILRYGDGCSFFEIILWNLGRIHILWYYGMNWMSIRLFGCNLTSPFHTKYVWSNTRARTSLIFMHITWNEAQHCDACTNLLCHSSFGELAPNTNTCRIFLFYGLRIYWGILSHYR